MSHRLIAPTATNTTHLSLADIHSKAGQNDYWIDILHNTFSSQELWCYILVTPYIITCWHYIKLSSVRFGCNCWWRDTCNERSWCRDTSNERSWSRLQHRACHAKQVLHCISQWRSCSTYVTRACIWTEMDVSGFKQRAGCSHRSYAMKSHEFGLGAIKGAFNVRLQYQCRTN